MILSAGSEGVLIYDWDGLETEPSENLRIFPAQSYWGTTARAFNNIYFIGTENGLEIYNLEE